MFLLIFLNLKDKKKNIYKNFKSLNQIYQSYLDSYSKNSQNLGELVNLANETFFYILGYPYVRNAVSFS